MELLRPIFDALPGIWKHRFFGLLTAVVVGALGVVGVSIIPDKYEAGARAYVDTQSILKPLLEGMAVQPNVEQQLRMMARALLSRPNLERVAEGAGLIGPDSSEGDRREVVTTLGVDVKFKPEGRSDFFSLTYRNASPEVARNVVDSLLEMFVETTRGDQQRDNKQALAFFDEQIAIYEQRLQGSEAALKNFKLKHIDVLPDLKDYFARAGDAQKEYEIARLQYREARNRAESIRNQLVGVPESVPSPEARQRQLAAPKSAAEQRLDAARRRLDDLSARYTELHPDVQNTSRIVRDLQRQVAVERRNNPTPVGAANGENLMVQNKLYQDLRLALSNAEGDVASLRARSAEARRRAEAMRRLSEEAPRVEAEFAQLNRDYTVTKGQYDKLLAKRESAQLSGDLGAESGAGDFRVVDPPSVGSAPIWPNRPLFLILILGLAVTAGVYAAFMRHFLSPSFYDPRVLQKTSGVQVLGEVAAQRGAGRRVGGWLSALVFWALSLALVLMFLAGVAWVKFRNDPGFESAPPAIKPVLERVDRIARNAAPGTVTAEATE